MSVGVMMVLVACGIVVTAQEQGKPVVAEASADVKNLQAQVAQLQQAIAKLSETQPKVSDKAQRKGVAKQIRQVCEVRGLSFDALHVEADGRSTVVCR